MMTTLTSGWSALRRGFTSGPDTVFTVQSPPSQFFGGVATTSRRGARCGMRVDLALDGALAAYYDVVRSEPTCRVVDDIVRWAFGPEVKDSGAPGFSRE